VESIACDRSREQLIFLGSTKHKSQKQKWKRGYGEKKFYDLYTIKCQSNFPEFKYGLTE
jgi:hypothetical protein